MTIARIFALADGGQGKALGQIHRHVFHGMYGDVGATLLHGDFELFHEQALAADFGQGRIQNLIAGGGHAQDGYIQRRV